MSNEEAIQRYRDTGKHLGVFSTPAAANAYAQRLHQDQEREYLGWPNTQEADAQAEKNQKVVVRAKPMNFQDWMKFGVGLGGTIVQGVDFMTRSLIGTVAGAGYAAFKQDANEFPKIMDFVQNHWNKHEYSPETKAASEVVNFTFNLVADEGGKMLGDKTMDATNSPLLATMADIAPRAIMMITPIAQQMGISRAKALAKEAIERRFQAYKQGIEANNYINLKFDMHNLDTKTTQLESIKSKGISNLTSDDLVKIRSLEDDIKGHSENLAAKTGLDFVTARKTNDVVKKLTDLDLKGLDLVRVSQLVRQSVDPQNQETIKGYRALPKDAADRLLITTGQSATEGQGLYVYMDQAEAQAHANALSMLRGKEHEVVPIPYRKPRNPLVLTDADLYPANVDLFSNITKDDSPFIAAKKQAVKNLGLDATNYNEGLVNEELANVARGKGHDVIRVMPDANGSGGGWDVVLDEKYFNFEDASTTKTEAKPITMLVDGTQTRILSGKEELVAAQLTGQKHLPVQTVVPFPAKANLDKLSEAAFKNAELNRKAADELSKKWKLTTFDKFQIQYDVGGPLKKRLTELLGKKEAAPIVGRFMQLQNASTSSMLFMQDNMKPIFSRLTGDKLYTRVVDGAQIAVTDEMALDEIVQSRLAQEISKRRPSYKFSGGLTAEHHSARLRALQRDLGPVQFSQLNEMADQTFNVYRNLLNLRLKEGLITPELHAKLYNFDYEPTQHLEYFDPEVARQGNVGIRS